MFIVYGTEFYAPSFTTKLTVVVELINELGGVPVNVFPFYVNHVGFGVIANDNI